MDSAHTVAPLETQVAGHGLENDGHRYFAKFPDTKRFNTFLGDFLCTSLALCWSQCRLLQGEPEKLDSTRFGLFWPALHLIKWLEGLFLFTHHVSQIWGFLSKLESIISNFDFLSAAMSIYGISPFSSGWNNITCEQTPPLAQVHLLSENQLIRRWCWPALGQAYCKIPWKCQGDWMERKHQLVR